METIVSGVLGQNLGVSRSGLGERKRVDPILVKEATGDEAETAMDESRRGSDMNSLRMKMTRRMGWVLLGWFVCYLGIDLEFDPPIKIVVSLSGEIRFI